VLHFRYSVQDVHFGVFFHRDLIATVPKTRDIVVWTSYEERRRKSRSILWYSWHAHHMHLLFLVTSTWWRPLRSLEAGGDELSVVRRLADVERSGWYSNTPARKRERIATTRPSGWCRLRIRRRWAFSRLAASKSRPRCDPVHEGWEVAVSSRQQQANAWGGRLARSLLQRTPEALYNALKRVLDISQKLALPAGRSSTHPDSRCHDSFCKNLFCWNTRPKRLLLRLENPLLRLPHAHETSWLRIEQYSGEGTTDCGPTHAKE
jgi:hypothetical protein